MFLHYLELEQQIAGYTALKMSSNPDTSTKSTLSDVEQTEANIEDLFFDARVPLEVVEAMMDDSILKSFFNGPMALAVSRPLFKLRYHKEVSDYLIAKKEQIRRDLETTFPGQNIEMFSNVFRNDIISFIFQNAIRKYKKEDGFMSLNMETTIPTALAKELKRGAFVKNGTLYMDMKQLRKEFNDGAWMKNPDTDNSYEDRGLYPLHPSTFMNNSEVNFNEYVKFVSEREYLRSITPMSKEYVDSFYFQEELKNTKELFEDLSNEKAVRYTYEKLLAIKALDNAYNFFHIFQDNENSFAMRMTQLLQNYKDLKKDYPVLSKLKFDSDKEDTAFNLFIADKDFDNDKSNLYSNDLIKLADPTVQKVKDPIENARISSMFKYLNTYAFLQTGLNKTKLSFTNIADFTDFLSIVELEADKFTEALNKKGMTVLDNFYDQFIRQNLVENRLKNRFKDYLSDMDYENPERIKPVENPTVKKVRTTTQPAASVKREYTPENITSLKPNEVFVFGSNAEGAHGKGAALIAKTKFGAIQGQAEGLQGQSYAIITKKNWRVEKSSTLAEIGNGIMDFVSFAQQNPNKKFYVTKIASSLAGYTIKEIADLWKEVNRVWESEIFTDIPDNIILPKEYEMRDKSDQPSTGVENDSTNMDTVSEPKRLGLKSTDTVGIFSYNDTNAKNTYYYLNLGKNNPDVVFIHNTSVYEIKPEQKNAGRNLGGSSNFMTEVPDMSVNIPTDLFASVINGQKVQLSPDQYTTLKNIWEKRIDLIKQLKEKGGKIAFPEYGFGNPRTMPQELFVYLSKRLFEEFQYINPGSTMYDEIRELVGITQGISDEEILMQLELEEDPFKCS